MTWIDDIQPEYGTVTGQYVAVSYDSADEGLAPDVQPLNGTVTLTPTAAAGQIDTALAQILDVTVRIFGGQIVDDEDQPGVRILSTDADIGVQDWAWTAKFQFDSGLKLKPLTFKVATGETVNLTSGIVPVESAPYQIVQGASAYEIAVANGFEGTEQEWVGSIPTSASVTVQAGASPGGTATVSGGVLNLALTVPPMGDGPVLTTESLDTITATGVYRQPANAEATLARGYPVAGVGGTLWAELRSAGSTSQRYTPHGTTPFRQYIRWGTPTSWGAWEGVESTTVLNSNLGSTDLNTVVIDGTYQQPANAAATLARNYPVASLGGTLQVRERSVGSVSQIWTPHGLAPYRMYFREGAGGVFKGWEGVETSGSKVGPEIVGAHLDTFTYTGTYRQSQPGYPAQGNLGYPPGSGPGVLLVFTRTGTLAAQVYISVGAVQEEQMHYRVNTDTGWTAWRALGGSAGGSSSEPDLLAGYETALGGL